MDYNFETGAKCTVHNIIHCEFFLSQIWLSSSPTEWMKKNAIWKKKD